MIRGFWPLAGYAVFNNHGGIIDAIIVGIIAGLGSTVGATVIYLVVRKLGRYAVIKYGKYIFLDNKKLSKIEEWFDRQCDGMGSWRIDAQSK